MFKAIGRLRDHGAVILLAGALLAGCTTEVQRQATRGDVGGVATTVTSNGVTFASFEANELMSICDSLQTARQFDQFFTCYAELERRVKANGGRLAGTPIPLFSDDAVAFNPAWTQSILLQMRSNAYLGTGDLDGAYADETRVLNIAKSKPFHLGSDPDPDIYYAQKARALMSALGKLGLIEAAWGDRTSALARAGEIEGIMFSSGFDISAGLPVERDGWMARIYAAVGEWEDAYRVSARDKESNFFSAFNDVLIQVNPLMPVALQIAGGTFDFDDLIFVSTFEPKFLRYRSALETGRLAEAKTGYAEILAEPRVKGYGNVYWRALHGQGRIDLAEGNRAAAISNFKTAIRVIESQRETIGDEGGRVSFAGDKQEVYRDLIDTLLSEGKPAEALAYAERGKARALVDILATKREFGAADSQSQALFAQFSQEEARRAGGGQSRSVDLAASRNRSIDTLSAQAPELASLVSVKAYTSDELISLVSPGETAIQYYQQGNALYAFVVQANGVQSFRLNGDRLNADVSRFRRGLSKPGRDTYEAAGRRIYEAVLAPLASVIEGDKVTIVPHGSLHYLPWSAIPTPRGFLIDDWEIAIAPSLSMLAFLGKDQAGAGMLAVGNPALPDLRLNLPGAEAEVKAISQLVEGATVLTGGAATETAVRNLGRSVDVLHLASHGVFEPQDPLSSALLLSADAANDGRLTAAEMYDLNLEANLVTLSACETGLGRVQSGDDVIGLIRGLLFAGADNVIASMWLVDDASTSILMQSLYKRMGAGASIPAALRTAQRELRDSEYAHPYYWAPFQVTGR